jgi:hypothetical protein
VHKSDSILPVDVCGRVLATFMFVPFDLVAANAVLSRAAETGGATSAEEPGASHDHIRVGVALNGDRVGELVVQVDSEVFPVVVPGDGKLVHIFELHHLILVGVSLKVVVSRDKGPWDLQLVNHEHEHRVVVAPELSYVLLLVPVEARNEVAGNGDQIGLLLLCPLLNHNGGLRIAVFVFREVQISGCPFASM